MLVQNHRLRTSKLLSFLFFQKLIVNNGTSKEEQEFTGIPTINNVGDDTQAFPEELFIPWKWINFQSLKEEGFA